MAGVELLDREALVQRNARLEEEIAVLKAEVGSSSGIQPCFVLVTWICSMPKM